MRKDIAKAIQDFIETQRADGAVHVRVRLEDVEVEATFGGVRRGAEPADVESDRDPEPELTDEDRQRAAEELLYYSAD